MNTLRRLQPPLTVTLAATLFALLPCHAADWPEFRGKGRTGVSAETGLLKAWPPGGPPLIWSATGIGNGFSSASIAAGSVYVTGTLGQGEVVTAFTSTGKRKWQTRYGDHSPRWPEDARTTPTVDGKYLYVISGAGQVACLNAATGALRWSVDAKRKFRGKTGSWTTAESPLIVGNKVIYTPGGGRTTVVALDKATGKTVWETASLKDACAYVSPILIERGGRRQIVAMTAKWVLGIAPESGRIVWKVPFSKLANARKANGINCCCPVYHDGRIYVTSGYNHGGALLGLSRNGAKASIVWEDETLDVHHGGVVLVNGYLYGSNWINNGTGNWVCLDWKTGKAKYETKWNNKGQIIAAEGMLYCYDEKRGNLGLVRATPAGFKVISSFKVPLGRGPHWAHPSLSNGRLYVRHGDALMVYDVRAR